MKTEKACGAIISRQNQQGKIEVLLVRQHNGLTGFPKGHMEEGETEEETARREVLEETGLEIVLDPTKRFEFDYIIPAEALTPIPGKTLEPIHKVVVLFLATLKDAGNETPQPQEIAQLLWLHPDEVSAKLNFPEWQAVWAKARPHLPQISPFML